VVLLRIAAVRLANSLPTNGSPVSALTPALTSPLRLVVNAVLRLTSRNHSCSGVRKTSGTVMPACSTLAARASARARATSA